MKYVGKGITALPNRQLAAGKGTFVSDVKLEGMLHLAIVRSPHAHANIRGIDTSAAEAVPGVVYVITGEEIKANMNPIMEAYDTAAMGAKGYQWWALMSDKVRFVGEAVAAVVAEDKYTARKAADLVAVDYETLPIVHDCELAMLPDSPLVESTWGDNILPIRRRR